MTETIRVTYERSYLVRRLETWTADIDPHQLTDDALDALTNGHYDPDLDQLITDTGDPEDEDYEDVDEWDIEGTPRVSCREHDRLELLLGPPWARWRAATPAESEAWHAGWQLPEGMDLRETDHGLEVRQNTASTEEAR